MGYIRHHAIVITGRDNSDIGGRDPVAEARAKAIELGLICTEMGPRVTNGYKSFMVVPDGSKEGWDTSNEFNGKRAAWIAWARQSRLVDWALVGFGGDDGDLAGLDDWSDKGANDLYGDMAQEGKP